MTDADELTDHQRADLRNWLDGADDPDWALELLGTALEATGGAFPRALAAARDALAEHPAPPPEPADEAERRVADAVALAEHTSVEDEP